jgi:hypothetical protein
MQRPTPGRTRCKLHGGLAGRPPGIPLRADQNAALQAARARWVEGMRAAKDAGLIERFPNGRRRGVPNGARAPDKHIRRAQLVIERLRNMVRKAVPALPADAVPAVKPWDEMSKAEKLSAATELALDNVRQILELGINPEDVKLLAQVKDTALTIISQQIRIEENELKAPRQDEPLTEYRQAVKAFEEQEARRNSKAKRKDDTD